LFAGRDRPAEGEVVINRESRDFFGYFARAYPGRTLVMVGLLVASGLAEGIGLAGLLPILELGVTRSGAEPSEFARTVEGGLARFGLEPTLGVLLLIVFCAMAMKGVFRWLAMRQVGFVVARVAMDLRLRLIRALMQAEWRYFATKPTGHFATAISSEAHRAASAYQMACSALAGLIQVAVYGTVVILVSWKVAALALIAGSGTLLLLHRLVSAARNAGQHQTTLMRSMVTRLTEALPGLKPLKAMAKEEYVLPLLESETQGFYRAQQRQVLATESLRAFQEPILVAVLAVGLFVVLTFTATPFSTVLVLAFLFYRLVVGLNNVQQRFQDMTIGESAFWSLMENLKEAEAAKESRTGTASAPPLAQSLRFEGVEFAYEPGRPVLNGIDLEIPAGEFVALVGPSGSGKSTLADLSIALLRPTAGRILVDGELLSEIDPLAWRGRIGYVPQDLLLFHDSILRNVTLGDESVSRERAEEALRGAGAWEFVNELPEGMDQFVGERGALLSGGQRQRIAIARALVGNPSLLILDEATTALDPVTEAGICQTLSRLKGRVTILAISHQMAMREIADVVYELGNGRVRRAETAGPGVGT
jgi:ATP-binding cassette subfamily C protein